MWNAYGALHGEVREHLKLDADAISLEIWSEGYGNDCLVQVTDNTRHTKWFHNPEIVGEIKHNVGLQRMFDDISIEYFDSAIYGDWDHLADDELVESSGAHTPPEYEDGDDAHYDALKQTGFFGEQAAGCIAMARTTGRILVVLRSAGVEQPHTWGNVGGAHHSDEQPREAAERELYEETGYHGRCETIPLMVFTKGSFRYCNFLALVDDEFVPVLGWEADDYKWVEFGDWPQPLHFGLQALFNDAASVDVIKSHISVSN
jgi:8-oxo-dGTP pyrophosphatase MutT (NUDIX family)